MIFPIVGIKLFGNERIEDEGEYRAAPEIRLAGGGERGRGGRRRVVEEVRVAVGSRVGVDLAPSNPAGSIPRHPMARRAKALAVIRADPNTRDLSLSFGNGFCPRLRGPTNVAASCCSRVDVSPEAKCILLLVSFVQSFES